MSDNDLNQTEATSTDAAATPANEQAPVMDQVENSAASTNDATSATTAPAATATPETQTASSTDSPKTSEGGSEAPNSTPTVAKDFKTNSSSDAEGDSLDTEQVVVFRLGGEEYAAPILDVQEIIPTRDITPFPNVPNYIAGIINVRGTVATVINLAKRFQLQRPEGDDKIDRYIILTNVAKTLFGIMVDDVTSVMKISKSNLKSSSGVTNHTINADYISNVSVQDDRIILILDFKRLLDDESLQAIGEHAQALPNAESEMK